jgi:hypothetical protein
MFASPVKPIRINSWLKTKCMKKIYALLMCVCLFSQPSQAVIRTLCNMPYSPGQFTTFAAALAAANVNDTIYVHGSSVTYGAITINKSVVLIGAGHNPNKQAPLPSSFTTVTINPGINNCQLIGLTMQFLTINSSSNHTVKRCKFIEFSPLFGTTGISCLAFANLTIEACVFLNVASLPANINFNNTSFNGNVFIRNNVFSTNLISNGAGTTPLTFFIENNIFLGNMGTSFTNINQAIINNNIFYRSSPQGAPGGAPNNVMNNNISFSCANNTFSAPGVNNLVNVNPLFVSFPIGGATFDYTHDYRLAAGSPGLLNGTDGTDRGVFGGFGGRFNMTGEPAMAEIFSFQITSATVIAPGGTLDISVTSKRVR